MSLPHAILTALLERPSSGLELTRRFDRSIGYFWSATHQQIYRELGKLELGGLIETVPQPPSRGQRKEYRVLPAGRSELVRWVAEGQDPKPVRDPLLLRLRAAAVVGTAGLDVELQRHLVEHRRQLDEYLEIERRDFPADGPHGGGGGDRLHHMVLKAGIALETFWVEWLAESIGELGGGAPGPAATPESS